MFEKEAEEWVKENMDCCKTDNSVNQSIPYFDEEERCCAKSAFQQGAEFGYNKAKIEAEESYKETFCNLEMNLKSVAEQLEELNKANEWHYVKDGDLPKDNQLILLYRENPNGANVALTYWYKSYVNDKVIAWKEIVLPELPKEVE